MPESCYRKGPHKQSIIILADEPTGNLDSKTSFEIMDILGKIHNDGNTGDFSHA
jgi:ABC-type lipoprotein export system ATPase subunit